MRILGLCLSGVLGAGVVFADKVKDHSPADVEPERQSSTNAVFVQPAKPIQASMWGGAGGWAGDVTYQIGGTVKYPDGSSYKVNDPLSELKWPLDVAVVSIGGCLEYQQQIDVFAEGLVSISDPSSKMEDSDWTEPWSPNYKTIYSESDTELSAYSIDGGLRVWILKSKIGQGTFKAGLGAGLIYQYMDWKTTTTEQWTLGYYDEFSDAGTYNIEVIMPYIEVSGTMDMNQFRLRGGLGVAPWVSASDEDDHKLRYIKSTADTTGYGVKAQIEGRFYFTKQFFALAELKGLYYKTDGTEKDHVYGGDDEGDSWEIDHTVESRQMSGVLGLGFEF